MTDTLTILLTLDYDSIKQIDILVSQCNTTKGGWQRPTNRQAVIRGLVRWALKQPLSIKSYYSKEVTIRLKKE